MGKLKYLVIHTTDTPYDREITPDDIYMWHLGPKNNNDGTYTYLGRKVTKAEIENIWMILPSGKKVKAINTPGRGWKQVGYSDMLNRKGELINLVPYNFDDVVDSFEITNGATGYNSNSRHIVLAGGWSKDGKVKNGKNPDGSYMQPEELYTQEQISQLIQYLKAQREIVPSIEIVGHNNLSQKTCPNFDVKIFLLKHII